MRQCLDLERLACNLGEVEETCVLRAEWENLNPYLRGHLLPRLERGDWPALQEIDFDAFDAEDPDALLEYFSLRENYQARLARVHRELNCLAPVCVKTRVFL